MSDDSKSWGYMVYNHSIDWEIDTALIICSLSVVFITVEYIIIM